MWSCGGNSLLTISYLLTYSMVQSPSWEANWFEASQKIHRISRKLKVHYRTHKRLPPVSILGQTNPVHIPTSHLLMLSTHLRPDLPSGLFPSGFPTKTLYTPLSSPIRATCSDHLILLDFIPLHNIGWGVQIIYLLVMQSPPFLLYLFPPRSKYSPQHHVLKHPQLPFLPQCQRPSFTPIQKNRQNYSSIYLDYKMFKYNETKSHISVYLGVLKTVASKGSHVNRSSCYYLPIYSLNCNRCLT